MTVSESLHYSYTLPPGWERIDLRGDLPAQVDGLLSTIAEQVPRDSRARVRVALLPTLLESLREAAAGGAYDMVVPVPADAFMALSTFLVSPLKWPAGVDAVEALTAIAASDSTAELKDVAGLVALRTHSDVQRTDAAQPARIAGEAGLGVQAPEVPTSRRVQYFIGDPERPGDWITALFSIPALDTETGRQWVDAEVSIFDGVMSTVRFFDA